MLGGFGHRTCVLTSACRHGVEDVKRGDIARKLDYDGSQGEWVYLDSIEAAIVTAEAGTTNSDGEGPVPIGDGSGSVNE